MTDLQMRTILQAIRLSTMTILAFIKVIHIKDEKQQQEVINMYETTSNNTLEGWE